PRHRPPRCAVAPERQKLHDALSEKPPRCAVGPQLTVTVTSFLSFPVTTTVLLSPSTFLIVPSRVAAITKPVTSTRTTRLATDLRSMAFTPFAVKTATLPALNRRNTLPASCASSGMHLATGSETSRDGRGGKQVPCPRQRSTRGLAVTPSCRRIYK